MVYMYTCNYKCCILHNGNVVPFNYLTIPFQSSWNSDTEVKSELVSRLPNVSVLDMHIKIRD